jgi:hypothetical protein
MQSGITTSVLAGGNAPPRKSSGHQVGKQPSEPSEINEENPGSPATHGTSGQVTAAAGVAVVAAASQARTRGLPALKTNPLGAGKR